MRDTLKGTEVWYFYSVNCPWCQKQAPVLDEFLEEHPEITAVKINVDEEPDAADMNGINSFPVIIPVVDGMFKNRINGFAEKDKISSAVFGD